MSKAPLETKEDLQLLKEYILLPLLLDALEGDIKGLEAMSLKMTVFYIQGLRNIQQQITLDLREIRQQLRNRGVKIYEQQSTSLGIEAHYLCRGYQHHFSMLWDLIQAELSTRFIMYLKKQTI